MKKLEILFGQKQHVKIGDLVIALSISKSDISRAAMQIGINALIEEAAKDAEKARDSALINSFKGKQ